MVVVVVVVGGGSVGGCGRSGGGNNDPMIVLFVCFCCFTSHVNSYGHCRTVSSLNHTFSWAGLSKWLTSNLCTYFRL